MSLLEPVAQKTNKKSLFPALIDTKVSKALAKNVFAYFLAMKFKHKY
ncbi:MAG: hypothetical protein GY705_08475 [Bacteroidetes bacterium]|nr:hypothetical protein [Bacteroidota bacterium]